MLKKFIYTILCFLLFLCKVRSLGLDCKNPPRLVDPQLCCQDGGPDTLTNICVEKFKVNNNHHQPQEGPLHDATCLAECILTGKNYIQGDFLNMTIVKESLREKYKNEPEFVNVMSSSFEKCGPLASQQLQIIKQLPDSHRRIPTNCSLFSGLVLGCTYMEYFKNCPKNKWTSNDQCELARDFVRKCLQAN